MAILKRLYNPMQGVVSFKTIDSQLIQEYDADNRTYSPDRRIVPTVVQPIVQVNDPAGKVVNGIKNAELAPEYIKYYENEPKPENEILDSNSGYRIDRTSTSANRGRITIRKNVDAESPITIVFEAVFADKVGAVVRRRLPVQGSFVLTTNVSAQSPLVLKEDYPRGKIFNPLKDFANMKLSADLFAGQKNIPSAFWWYKKTGATETLLTDAYEGHNLREVKIPSVEIGKQQNYLVKVQDCRSELNVIQNDFFQAELDKNTIVTPSGAVVLNNEIKNGNFRDGGNKWTVGIKVNNAVFENNSIELTFGEETPNIGRQGGIYQNVEMSNTDKYYFSLVAGLPSGVSHETFIVHFACNYTPSFNFDIASNTTAKRYSIVKNGASGAPSFIQINSQYKQRAIISNIIVANLTQAFGKDNEPSKQQMDTYLADKPYITNTDELIAEMKKMQLPIGHRPTPNPLKQKTAELTLSTQYPPYSHRVVTDFGDDANIITIPSDVDTFNAWVEFHTPAGVILNPEKYFNVNWGGGKTGISQTFNADDIGLDLYTLEPTITEKL